MKYFAPIPLLIGLFVGSFATYKFTRPSKSPTTDENVSAEKNLEEPNESKANPNYQSQRGGDGAVAKSKNSDAQDLDQSHDSKPSLMNDSQPMDSQVCLDRLKPSEVEEWQSKWRKRVKEFVSSNDAFWDSQGNRNFDTKVIPSIRGTYKGSWSGFSNAQLKADFKLTIMNDTDGNIQLSLIDRGSSPAGPLTSNCSQDLMPRKHLGLDEKENAVNVFMHNCNPGMLGAIFSQFAFKIPLGLQKGQQKVVEVFGLTEDFNWKSTGTFNFQKL